MMNIVKTDIKNMQDIAPLIDDDIIEIYNSKYRRYKRVKKPNFVNGLTEVKVNPYNNEREYEFASRHGSREASPNNTNVIDNQPPSASSHTSSHQNQNNPSAPDKNQSMNNEHNEDNLSVEPVDVTTDPNAMMNPGSNNEQLLQMYKQLQAQAQAASLASAAAASHRQSMSPSQIQLQVHSQTQSPMQNASSLTNVQPSQSPTLQNNIVVPSAGPSPATSVRSTASLHLGQIQTDPNGNQGVNI
jgi:hypothetical protein